MRPFLPMAGRAALNAYRHYRGSSGTRALTTRRRETNNVVTAQHDISRPYKRRPMPRRRRRQWTRQIRRFRALTLKHLATRSRVLTYAGSSTATAGNQARIDAVLYGYYGANNARGLNDLQRIADAETNAQDIASNPGNTVQFGPRPIIIFKSAVMDMSITNTSSTVVLELDVYYFYVTRKTAADSTIDALSDGFQQADTLTEGGTPMDIDSLGVTPFDCPNFLKSHKITQVRKIIIAPGQISSLMIKAPQNKKFDTNRLSTELPANGVFGLPGYTRGIFLIGKGAPSAASGAQACSFAWSFQNKYHYSIMAKANSMDQYN